MFLLAEQLFLLAIEPNTGRPYIRANTVLPYSLSGALLAELMIVGKIREDNKKLTVITSEVDDLLLQETLSIMAEKNHKKVDYWIYCLENTHKGIPRKIASKLDKSGIGTIKTRKILGLFPSYTFTFEQEKFVENRKKAFQIVLDKFSKQEKLGAEEEKIAILMSLVYVSGLVRVLFTDKNEAQKIEKQMKKLSKELPIAKAVQSVVDAINVTTMTAVNSTH